jgi:hypothetical protein
MFELTEEEIKNYVPENLTKLLDKKELAILASIRAMQKFPGYGEVEAIIQNGQIQGVKCHPYLRFDKDWKP